MRIPLTTWWFFNHKIQTYIRVAFMQMHKKNPFSIKSYLYWSNFIANFMSPFAMFLTFLFHFPYLKTNLLCVTFLARAYKHRHTQTGILNFYFILLSLVPCYVSTRHSPDWALWKSVTLHKRHICHVHTAQRVWETSYLKFVELISIHCKNHCLNLGVRLCPAKGVPFQKSS